MLKKHDLELPWGEDFGAPHETALGTEFGKPVFVHHMPSQIKAFYFKQSDTVGGPAAAHGKYALGCDLIAPDGYGEIIGGGQREESADVLKARIEEHGLSEAGLLLVHGSSPFRNRSSLGIRSRSGANCSLDDRRRARARDDPVPAHAQYPAPLKRSGPPLVQSCVIFCHS